MGQHLSFSDHDIKKYTDRPKNLSVYAFASMLSL